jgi:hypothetical protein
MGKRGDRIIERQKQCSLCRFFSEKKIKEKGWERVYGFCLAKDMRLCDMNIWEDCKKYKPKVGRNK